MIGDSLPEASQCSRKQLSIPWFAPRALHCWAAPLTSGGQQQYHGPGAARKGEIMLSILGLWKSGAGGVCKAFKEICFGTGAQTGLSSSRLGPLAW